jgi:hypothetical protein
MSMSLLVKGFPKMIKRFCARFSTGIDEDANFWFKLSTNSIEEPSVRIDLLAVLLFEAENHLYGYQIARIGSLDGSHEGRLCIN